MLTFLQALSGKYHRASIQEIVKRLPIIQGTELNNLTHDYKHNVELNEFNIIKRYPSLLPRERSILKEMFEYKKKKYYD